MPGEDEYKIRLTTVGNTAGAVAVDDALKKVTDGAMAHKAVLTDYEERLASAEADKSAWSTTYLDRLRKQVAQLREQVKLDEQLAASEKQITQEKQTQSTIQPPADAVDNESIGGKGLAGKAAGLQAILSQFKNAFDTGREFGSFLDKIGGISDKISQFFGGVSGAGKDAVENIKDLQKVLRDSDESSASQLESQIRRLTIQKRDLQADASDSKDSEQIQAYADQVRELDRIVAVLEATRQKKAQIEDADKEAATTARTAAQAEEAYYARANKRRQENEQAAANAPLIRAAAQKKANEENIASLEKEIALQEKRNALAKEAVADLERELAISRLRAQGKEQEAAAAEKEASLDRRAKEISEKTGQDFFKVKGQLREIDDNNSVSAKRTAYETAPDDAKADYLLQQTAATSAATQTRPNTTARAAKDKLDSLITDAQKDGKVDSGELTGILSALQTLEGIIKGRDTGTDTRFKTLEAAIQKLNQQLANKG